MKRKAYYPVTHAQIKTFTASSAFEQVSIDTAYFGQIPETIRISMVRNAVFFGSTSTNTFHFHRYDMTNVVLYVNGVQHPSEPLTIDCFLSFETTRACETLFSTTGIHHDDRVHMITLEMFTRDLYLVGFDLTPDR